MRIVCSLINLQRVLNRSLAPQSRNGYLWSPSLITSNTTYFIRPMHSSKDTTKASSKGHAPPKVPVVPRHSASLVLVNARNQVLLVHRNPESRTFAGIHASVHTESLENTLCDVCY